MEEAHVLRRMFELTRGDLDREGVRLPVPLLTADLPRLSFVRLTRLARSWQVREQTPASTPVQGAEQVLAGLSASWMFILKGSARQLECWFGLPLPPEAARAVIGAAFPDARFGDQRFDPQCLERLDGAVQLTGVPSRRPDGTGDALEKLCRGLGGTRWVYAVHAVPMLRPRAAAARNELLQELDDLRLGHGERGDLRPGEQGTTRRLADLIEANVRRLDQGRAGGMWTTRVLLAVEDARSTDHGRAVLHSAFAGDSAPEPIRTCICGGKTADLPYGQILTGTEAALLAHPPAEEFPGYELTELVRFGVEPDHGPRTEAAVSIGPIQDHGTDTGNELTLTPGDLAKHALIVGVTGSGKTNTCFHLLEQVWNGGRGVPFLVIESAKSEYRALLRQPAFRGLKVFTVGDETTAPLRLNPFEVPPGVLVQTHLDYLKMLFSAAFVL